MSKKAEENQKYIAEQVEKGRDHIFQSELPHKTTRDLGPDVIGRNGNVIYLRSKEA